MSDKDPAIEEVAQPGEYPPEEVGERREEFLAGIKEALAQVERGETYTIEEVREYLRKCLRQ